MRLIGARGPLRNQVIGGVSGQQITSFRIMIPMLGIDVDLPCRIVFIKLVRTVRRGQYQPRQQRQDGPAVSAVDEFPMTGASKISSCATP